jgi:hypothetical protein
MGLGRESADTGLGVTTRRCATSEIGPTEPVAHPGGADLMGTQLAGGETALVWRPIKRPLAPPRELLESSSQSLLG